MEMMKRLMCLILVGICFLGANVSVSAYELAEPIVSSVEEEADVTKWYYRQNPTTGRTEKRLWSFTYGIWLTDWLPL